MAMKSFSKWTLGTTDRRCQNSSRAIAMPAFKAAVKALFTGRWFPKQTCFGTGERRCAALQIFTSTAKFKSASSRATNIFCAKTRMTDSKIRALTATRAMICQMDWLMSQSASSVRTWLIIFASKHPSHQSHFPLLADQPIVASFPHFYSRPGKFLEKLDGLRPDPIQHSSYTIVEPNMGIPLNQRAVSQSNVVTKNLKNYKDDIARFSEMVLPMFWCEYVRIEVPPSTAQAINISNLFQYLKELTPIIIDTVDFIVNTLPKIQYWVSSGFIIIGLCLLTMGYFRLRRNVIIDAVGKESVKNWELIEVNWKRGRFFASSLEGRHEGGRCWIEWDGKQKATHETIIDYLLNFYLKTVLWSTETNKRGNFY